MGSDPTNCDFYQFDCVGIGGQRFSKLHWRGESLGVCIVSGTNHNKPGKGKEYGGVSGVRPSLAGVATRR